MTITQRFHNLVFGENSRERNRHHYLAEARGVTLPALASPDERRVWGPDLSPWDGNVDLATTRMHGAAFAFIKGLDGTVGSRCFPENRIRAIEAGILQAPYQWLYRNANVPCVAQAQALDRLLQVYPPDLPPVVDFEWTRWMGFEANPTYADLELWVSEFLRLGNSPPIVYSAPGYMNDLGRMPDSLRAKFAGLWVASWGGSTPSLPWGWPEWLFWQFSSSGDALLLAPGDTGKLELDLNYWCGDLRALHIFAGLEEDHMASIIKGTALGSVKRRQSPAGAEFNPPRYLERGDRIEASNNDAQWLHLTKINDVPVVGDEWASAGASQQYISWGWVTVPDPPPPTATRTHTIDVFDDGSVVIDGSPVP